MTKSSTPPLFSKQDLRSSEQIHANTAYTINCKSKIAILYPKKGEGKFFVIVNPLPISSKFPSLVELTL